MGGKCGTSRPAVSVDTSDGSWSGVYIVGWSGEELEVEGHMVGKFTYSLNGSEYTGQFDTRGTAESAAIEAARRSPAAPATVYVGRMVGPDTMAAGHAR